MEFVTVEKFVYEGEDIEPYCDVCQTDESDVGEGMLYGVNFGQYDNFTVCGPCRRKLLEGLSKQPTTSVILDQDVGSYKPI